ncbi:hypothetical protein HYX16_00315 [Candidatus Woesearchaeota archaeon]|nr:hypothetical protein [Candidatus Woesearchaeota archaeon]
MSYIAVCLKGLEEVAENETKGKKIIDGRIKFSQKPKNFKSISTIYSLKKQFKFKKQEDILKEFKKLKLKVKKSFKVNCNREGKHKFKSVDVEKLIGIYLQKQNHKLDFKNPGTVIYVDIINNECLIGLLEKDSLQKRNYRIKLNPETLNPCIAFAALKLINYKKNDILVDPFCRDGILVIEAALLKNGKVYGFDRSIRHSRINSKIAKVKIELSQDELDWLDTKFKKSSVKVATFIPCVSKNNKETDIRRIYSELMHQMDFITKDYASIIVKKPDLIKSYIHNFNIERELIITKGDDTYSILILKKSIKTK